MDEIGTQPSPYDGKDDYFSISTLILVLLGWWREIALGTILAAVVGGVIGLAKEFLLPTYEAVANVAILGTRTDVAIGDSFQTDSATPGPGANRDAAVAHRAALVGLVHDGEIAQFVIEQLAGILDEDDMIVDNLLKAVEAELVVMGPMTDRNSSDLIRVAVTADSSEKALAIAESWTAKYEKVANNLFEQVPQELFDSISEELTQVQQMHVSAQAELERFSEENNIEQLKHMVETKRNLAEIWMEAQLTKVSQTYAIRQRLGELLDGAKGLRDQIKKGGETSVATNGLAILMLKTKAFSLIGSSHSGNIEVRLENVHALHANAAEQAADVEAIIVTLENQLVQLSGAITDNYRVSSDSFDGTGPKQQSLENAGNVQDFSANSIDFYQLAALEEEIKSLSMMIEKLRNEKEILIQNRDRASAARSIVENENLELRLTRSAATSVVRAGPSSITSTRGISSILIAFAMGVLGLLAMSSLALFQNSIGLRPFLTKRETEQRQNSD